MELIPHLNLWIERDGNVVLSQWRVMLLEAIGETGSISAAAERLGVDYHRAWNRLQEMERGLGIALIERQAGGPGGGGARLTPVGRDYVARFNQFAQGIDALIVAQFSAAFAGDAILSGPMAQAKLKGGPDDGDCHQGAE
jgi:molybdate transport system regulatory protein